MMKLFKRIVLTAVTITMLVGCTSKPAETDTTIRVYTHMGQQILGEEKKDADGNTYRDEDTAYLLKVADRFTEETGIKVEFEVADEEDVEPLLRVQDPSVDIYTAPNWTIPQYKEYAEPFGTIEEVAKDYGEYAKLMPNDGESVYLLQEARGYENGFVYNEDAIKSVGYDEFPGTLADFDDMNKKLIAAGITPIALHRIENWPLGGIDVLANYISGVNSGFTEGLKLDDPFSAHNPIGGAIKLATEWKSKKYFEQEIYSDFGVAMDAVAYGTAASMFLGAWVVPQIQGRVPEGTSPSVIKMSTAPDVGKGRFITGVSMSGWAISKGSLNKEASRQFIDFIAEDAQYLADFGAIANKKGVEPIVPEFYKTIDDLVEKGEVSVLLSEPRNQNTINMEELLIEANLKADNKHIGLPFDALDITKPNDWAAFDKQIQAQNEAFVKYRTELGIKWID